MSTSLGGICRCAEALCTVGGEGSMHKFHLCSDLTTVHCLLEGAQIVSRGHCPEWAEQQLGSFLRRAQTELTDKASGIIRHWGPSAAIICSQISDSQLIGWEFFTFRFSVLSAEKMIGWSWLTAPPWRMCSIPLPFSSWEKVGRSLPLYVLGLFSARLSSTVFLFVCLFCLCLFRATPMAYGSSQARGPVRAVAASLRQSHSNARPNLRLRPTPQLTAMPDP